MEDSAIIDLYWSRDEVAISETDKKYGHYCRSIAYNILRDECDCEECVNDTYLRTWNSIPPKRPERLAAFLGRITRNLSINAYDRRTAGKRGGGQIPLVLDELSDCVSNGRYLEHEIENGELAECIDRFLAGLNPEKRIIFVRRYWYMMPIADIAAGLGISESKVKMTLMRLRAALREYLSEEGFSI